ncbi:hypothetical protein I7I48_03535 [Histoplasma ohiense]|nr:hypothetical protein I7I48_03535 [Histoplasma ohiense (nom. inval.)]
MPAGALPAGALAAVLGLDLPLKTVSNHTVYTYRISKSGFAVTPNLCSNSTASGAKPRGFVLENHLPQPSTLLEACQI